MSFHLIDLQHEAKRVHKLNKKWWLDLNGIAIERDKEEMLMLMVSECSEAMEGVRKDLMDDHLPHRKMEHVEIADVLIRILDYAGGWDLKLEILDPPKKTKAFKNPAAELLWIVACICYLQEIIMMNYDKAIEASALHGVIRALFRYAKNRNIPLFACYEEKLSYNQHREDHKLENRRKKGGKKF